MRSAPSFERFVRGTWCLLGPADTSDTGPKCRAIRVHALERGLPSAWFLQARQLLIWRRSGEGSEHGRRGLSAPLEMRQDLFDHGWIFDARDHLHGATTVFAGQDVDLEYPLQTLRPPRSPAFALSLLATLKRRFSGCGLRPSIRKWRSIEASSGETYRPHITVALRRHRWPSQEGESRILPAMRVSCCSAFSLPALPIVTRRLATLASNINAASVSCRALSLISRSSASVPS